MTALVAHELRKSFGETRALDGVSFAVKPGEIFGLIGPDGAGKTTAMRLLVGVLDADSGSVEIAGRDVAGDPDAAREEIGYMPQHFSLYRDLTVEENLKFFADMYFVKKAERKKRLEELYAFSRLAPFAKRPAGKLSGGMQKKLALSCGMIHTPKVLLLDEPTTGVDPVSRRELWDILYRFADRGVAMVVCTPYMDEAERCHRVGLIHKGRFLIVDAPSAVIDKHDEAIWELLETPPEEARRVLAGVEGIRDVYPCGDALHVATAPGLDEEPVIRGALVKANLPLGRVERRRPTFEDVFMARIRMEKP